MGEGGRKTAQHTALAAADIRHVVAAAGGWGDVAEI